MGRVPRRVPRRGPGRNPRLRFGGFDAGGVAVGCADALDRPLARSLSLLAALAAMILMAGGGVGQKYVNETLYGPTREPQKHTDPMIVPDVRPEAYNDVAIAGAPVGVQASFRQEHPDAVVTN